MAIIKHEGNFRTVIGHLTKEAEFSIVGKKDVERTIVYVAWGREKGDVIKCTLWRGLAIAAQDLQKFDCILASGEVKKSEFNGKEYFEMNVDDAIFMSFAPRSSAKGDGFTDVPTSDIPF